MNRYLPILAIPFFMLLLTSCIEDTLENSQTTEMYYVDLLDALHHHDQAGAKGAAQHFTKSISGFLPGHYNLRSEEEIEDTRFYLNKAEQSYFEASASIEKGELEQAMIQLNRGTTALEAARIPGLRGLYIASVHGFLSSWLELSRISRKEDLSPRKWRAINHRIKAMHTFWRQCRGAQPSQSVYFFSAEDSEEFTKLHGEVDRLIGLLKKSLSEEDEVLTKSYINVTDAAVWDLVRHFGSPKEGELKVTTPKTTPLR